MIKLFYIFDFLLVVLIHFLIGLHYLKKGLTYFHYVLESKGNEILESVVEYIRQKLKKHVHLKISSRDEVLTRLFSFFHRGINFYLCLFDRDEFIPGKFISAKRCKQEETFRHRQGSSWDEISRANTF